MRTKVKILQHNRLQTVLFQYHFKSKQKTAPIFLRVQ